MKPIMAGILSSLPVSTSISTPPIIASGMFIRITSDCLMLRNWAYSSMKITARARSDVIARVRDAADSLSNCPP